MLMSSVKLLAGAIVFTLANAAWAAAYETEVLTLQIPEGFEGPKDVTAEFPELFKAPAAARRSGAGKMHSMMFMKKDADGTGTTALTVSMVDLGRSTLILPETMREQLLRQFATGSQKRMARRRDNFSATQPVPVTLNGVPALKSSWEGDGQGQSMRGVDYFVVLGSKAFYLQAKQLSTAPAEELTTAASALEAVSFERYRAPAADRQKLVGRWYGERSGKNKNGDEVRQQWLTDRRADRSESRRYRSVNATREETKEYVYEGTWDLRFGTLVWTITRENGKSLEKPRTVSFTIRSIGDDEVRYCRLCGGEPWRAVRVAPDFKLE